MKSTIRLFKSLPITKEGKKKASKELLKETVKRGFVFSPEVCFNYSEQELLDLIKIIQKETGLSPEQMNSSFHKSWEKVATADIMTLVIEQICHYITTYGYERLGIYDESTVYIPSEELKIPKTNLNKIKLIVIKGYTKEQLKDKILKLIESGIALSEDTKKDVIDIVTFVGIQEDEIHEIRNKEVKIALYDYFGIVPENPIEFLRYTIYKSANKTLLIKDKITISEIKRHDNLDILRLFEKFQEKQGLQKLASIFYRFKPLFLAFRTNKKLKTIINKIRKLAYKYHEPMKADYLNNVTFMVKHNKIDNSTLEKELKKANVFRKIRLAYALKFRTKNPDSILYRIRNGKSYATSFEFKNKYKAEDTLATVLCSIVDDIQKQVSGKKIYIPENIQYALPATEKQFTGYLPSGTCITVPKNIIVGIHWENVEHHRIDLDLSLITAGKKFGWNSYWRDDDRHVLFSGDVTDAPKPKGASELYYIKKQTMNSFIMFVNYYNYDSVEVPFKILVAQEATDKLYRNYTVNPNNVVAITSTKIFNERQKMLGLLVTSEKENKFYFVETYLGNSIISGYNDYSNQARKYLFDFFTNSINFNEILERAGAKIVKKEDKCDINLSPEKLEKDTIINLLR